VRTIALALAAVAAILTAAPAGAVNSAQEEQNEKVVVDFYEKGLEHWDVIRPVPEKSANTNGMF
jgi:hypothetical protein